MNHKFQCTESKGSASPLLRRAEAVLIIIISAALSPWALADYGDSFIEYKCSKNNQLDMRLKIIWNEELDSLRNSLQKGRGVITYGNMTLYDLAKIKNPFIESTCKIDNMSTRIRVGNLGHQDEYTITLFENEKQVAHLITEGLGTFAYRNLKIRYSSKRKWQFLCQDENNSAWEMLPPKPMDELCSYAYLPPNSILGCFKADSSLAGNSYPILRWECGK